MQFLQEAHGDPFTVVSSVVQTRKTLQARIISGSIVLLSGSGLNTGINLAYNIAVARYLGPTGFGHATVIYTILVLLSAVTLSFQIIATKMIAQQESSANKAAIYRFFHRASWAGSIAVALLLVAFQGPISGYLNLPDANLITLIAVGAAFYIPLGARRGYIQGTCGFRSLALNLVIEQAIRLGGSLALIGMGFGLRLVSSRQILQRLRLPTTVLGSSSTVALPIRFASPTRLTKPSKPSSSLPAR